MRKPAVALLILISLLVCFLPIKSAGAFAAAENNAAISKTGLKTDIFLPTSYLQYYKLDNPYAICRYDEKGETFVAISHAGAIVVYRCSSGGGSEQFKSVPISGSPSIGVSSIAKYKNFLIFTQWSNICYIDVSDFETISSRPQVKTGNACSNSFSVSGDEIAVTTTEGITYYDLSITEGGELEFTRKTDKKYNFETNNPSAVLLSDDGKTYFYSADAKAIMEYIPESGKERIVVPNAENVKSVAKSAETGDELYYSSSNGLFSADPASGESELVCPVATEGERDLGKLWNPKGICVVDGKLWVVDAENSDKVNSINAVQEFDLESAAFTDFAITTNSKAVNRLTEKASDIAISGDKIYALDGERIVVINGADKDPDERSYNRINISSGADEFAVYGDYLAYSSFNASTSTSKITVAKITRGEDGNDPILNTEILYESAEKLSGVRIRDISGMDDVFYFIGGQLNSPVLYSFNAAEPSSGLAIVRKFDSIDGLPTHVSVDPFNTVYFSVKKPGGGGYVVYKYENGSAAVLASITSGKELLSMQTDLDGKIYLLFENNLVECYDGNEKKFSETIKTSENLGKINQAAAMAVGCDSRRAYFIFEGLILRSSENTDMEIATPYTINIPADFSLGYSKNETYGKLREGAKLFEVSSDSLSGEYFKFEKFATESGNADYAVKDLGGKYYLVLKEKRTAIVRKSDFLESGRFSVTPLNLKAYAVTDFEIYGLPILDKAFAAGKKAKKYAETEITGELKFNGDEYYVVKTENSEGLIPKTFLKDGILTEASYTTIENAYVYAKGGADVYDEDLTTTTDKITSYVKVVVLSVSGDYAKISYDGKVGYIKTEFIVKDSKNNAVKALAIIILAFSLFVTMTYFEKRYLLKSE